MIQSLFANKVKERKEVFEIKKGASMMAETFATCILEDIRPEISGEEGLKALEIVLACVEASEKHERVKI